MTKEQILERIDQLEYNIFMLYMKDRWSREDHDTYDCWERELRALQAQVQG